MDWDFAFVLAVFVSIYIPCTHCIKFETILNKLDRPDVNVTWDSDGSNSNVTLKRTQLVGLFDEDRNNVLMETTSNDFVVVRGVDFKTSYNMTLIVIDDDGQEVNKESRVYNSPLAPQVHAETTQEMATLLLVHHPNASFYQIIARELRDDENSTTLNELQQTDGILQSTLRGFDGSNTMQYITVNISQSEVGMKDQIIKIGDGTQYGNDIVNAALRPNTRYSFFQRTFINETNHASYDWTEAVTTPMMTTTTTTTTTTTATTTTPIPTMTTTSTMTTSTTTTVSVVAPSKMKAPIPEANGYEVKVPITKHLNAVYYLVIARRLEPDENSMSLNKMNFPPTIQQKLLQTYADNKTQYITLNITVVKDSYVLIGTGEETNGVLNAKLEPDTRYSFFQRTFLDNSEDTISSNWTTVVRTMASTAKELDDLDESDIAIITVGVAIGLITIIFFIVVCCHWKYSRNYAPKPKKLKNSDPVQRQLTDPGIPVTENDFYDHVAQMKFHNFKGFYEEFTKMSVEFKPSEIFGKPENIDKNRFHNVPCLDHSIVPINKSKLEAENTYIHANFVPGYDSEKDYILTQSPLPETIKDFWTMVWEYDIDTIVMIGQRTEKGNKVCAPYFPEKTNAPVTTLHGEVRLEKEHRTADYVVRHLILVGQHGIKTKKVQHFQFLSWPAVRITPACPTVFLQFMRTVNKSMTNRNDKPIVIHGTTGTGRPGIYACVDTQIHRLQKQGDVNVYTAVQDIREYRFDGVKTLDEYIFIHDTVLEYILKKNIKDIDVEHLPHYIENSSKNSPGELFSIEYNFLAATVVSAAQKMDVANQPCNKSKNRYDNIKPFDVNRVKLSKQINEEGSDYINASYMDTFSYKQSFIATQAPLVGTVSDFWRMIYEHESWVIVMLGQEIEKGQLKADRFWPEEGYVMALGHLTVKYISKQSDVLRDVVIRQIELLHEQSGEKKLVQVYQYLSWPSHEGITSESIHSLVQLVHQSQLWKEKLKSKSITLVSSSGVGRPGVFVALRSLQEESELEGKINIFQTVQKLRQQRVSMIQTREEYILIYTAAMEITKHVRRKSIVAESLADVSSIGMDILPNSLNGSINSSIMERLNSVSQTSKF